MVIIDAAKPPLGCSPVSARRVNDTAKLIRRGSQLSFFNAFQASLEFRSETNCFPKKVDSGNLRPVMSLSEILEELPNLTESEKRHLRNVLDHELSEKDEEGPEVLAAIDERIRSLDSGEKTRTVEEVRRQIHQIIDTYSFRSRARR